MHAGSLNWAIIQQPPTNVQRSPAWDQIANPNGTKDADQTV